MARLDVKTETIRIEGLDELDAFLKSIDDKLRREIIREALRESAEPIVTKARQKVRRHPFAPTRADYGHLADHIIADKPRAGKDGGEIKIGPDYDYFWGLFLEFGTPRMQAYPFMRPATDQSIDEVLKLQNEIMRRFLEAEGR